MPSISILARAPSIKVSIPLTVMFTPVKSKSSENLGLCQMTRNAVPPLKKQAIGPLFLIKPRKETTVGNTPARHYLLSSANFQLTFESAFFQS